MKKTMVAVVVLLVLTTCSMAQTENSASFAAASSDAQVVNATTLSITNDKSGALGFLVKTCYSDGSAFLDVQLSGEIRLGAGERIYLKAQSQSVAAIDYEATSEQSLHDVRDWSATGCGAANESFELVKVERAGTGSTEKPIGYAQFLQPSGNYTAYLASQHNGKIGTLYENCYPDGTAHILVELSPGIYLKSGQSLVVTPAGKKIFAVYYTAKSNQEVQNFQGWSSIGCVAPPTVLDLDTVTAPPNRIWTEDAYTIWF